ncbi:Ger(x)C family spore germination protein [Paenibacillus kobensis]|uniref:Ger(x)C family spore germination protein n=1 Tax=Paenibacillus kobensis TaxID=59841 RepID=UPI000FD769F7|nr:Ger(x)C family spore germination protein [Paenibacillus kobensis]
MNGKLRRILCAAALVWTTFIATGCWNRIELNELAITSATGIDWDGSKWIISYQVVIPAAISSGIGTTGGTQQSPIVVYSTEGRTIREAMMYSFSESPRKLFYGHNRVVVLSEEVARRGFEELIDVYFRNAGPRETVSMLVTPGSARRILEQFMQLQLISGDGMKDIVLSEMKNASILPNVQVYQLAMELAGDAKSAVLPEIYISGSGDTASLDSFKQTTIPSKLKLRRLAVLRQGRMVGWMNQRQSLGVSYLRNRVQQTGVTVPCEKTDGTRGYDMIHISRSSTKLKPIVREGRLAYSAEVHALGTLTESGCPQNLYKPEVIRKIEQGGELQIRTIIQEAWSRGQQLGVDVFGAAESAHRKHPQQWKKWSGDWNSVFTSAALETNVHLRIARMGLSNKSFQYITNQDKRE